MISIKNIILNNFRNYKNAEVNLSQDNGVFFIYGDNGAGKSTILNAINWCLYGDIVFHGVEFTPEVKPNWANEGDTTEVKLIIQNDDNTYQFRRTVSGFDNVGVLEAREISDTGNAGRSLPEYEVNSIIKQVLPENIKNLFFLSENFSNEILGHKSTNSLKSNVHKVSELDTITSAIEHLDLTESYYAKTISKATKDYEKITSLASIIEHDKKMVDENEKGIELAKTKIAEHEEALNKLKEALVNSKQTRELVQQRDFWKSQLNDVEDNLAKDDASITECMHNTFYKVLLVDEIAEYSEALSVAREAGKIPAPINPKIIAQSKRDGICACCLRKITEKEIEVMDKQQAKYEEIDRLKFLADGINEFSDLREQIKASYYVLCDAMESRDKNSKKKISVEEQLDAVSEKIDSAAEANIPDNPEERRREIEGKIEKWQIRRREYANNIVQLKTEIEKSYAERKRLMTSAGGDAQSLEAELDKIKELRDLLVELRESTEEIIKERIKEGVWESFKKILPDTQFAEISLDDNYSFSFIDKGGFESKVGKLSVGEAKTLALALISTLSNDIGYSDTPLFVDNLFAGIETSHFEDITRCVESLSDKKQIFITYLYAKEGARVSRYFNPAVIRQEIKVVKGDDGICRAEETK